MKKIKRRKLLLAIVVLLVSMNSYTQVSPGGVNTGLTTWFKADNAATLTGNPVSSWSTSGGTATGYTITQATAINRPGFVMGATEYVKFNYNPRIKFGPTLTNLRNAATTPNLMSTNGTAFIVTDQFLDGNALTYYSSTSYRYQYKPFFRFQTGALGIGYTFNWGPPTEYPSTAASILVGYGCGASMAVRRNSVQTNTPSQTATTYNPAISTGMCVGANNLTEPFKSGIAEIILFNNKPSLADMDKIESYLAIKYGVTRGGNTGTTATYNYISSGNTVLWDKTLNTGFNFDIAVIGRDDASGLTQKQSISVNNGEALTIALGNAVIPADNPSNSNNFPVNISFLAWGNNGQAKTFNTSANKPSGITERLNRVWKTQSTNFGELTTFGFETGQLTGLGTTTDLCLLFDDDGDFTNATVVKACSAVNPTGTRLEFTGVSIPAGLPYVTMARVQLTTFSASGNSPICAGSNLNLTISSFPNTTYSWSGPNGFNSTTQNPTIPAATIAASSPPDYIATATIYGGCISTASTSVIVNPLVIPTINILANPGNTICMGASVTFTASVTNEGTAPVYQWKINGANVGTNSSTYTGNAFNNMDVITCELTSNILCASSNSITSNVITLTVLPQPIVDAGPPVFIISGDQAQLSGTASNANSYLWTPSLGLNSTTILRPIAKPPITTLYTLSVTNGFGCSASDDVLVTVVPYCIKVRNAFTPNGDGINDLWVVYDQFDCLKNVTVHVYNRYGTEVYASKDYRNNWDGRYKNKPAPDGTYYAIIEIKLINDNISTIKTDLTILR